MSFCELILKYANLANASCVTRWRFALPNMHGAAIYTVLASLFKKAA